MMKLLTVLLILSDFSCYEADQTNELMKRVAAIEENARVAAIEEKSRMVDIEEKAANDQKRMKELEHENVRFKCQQEKVEERMKDFEDENARFKRQEKVLSERIEDLENENARLNRQPSPLNTGTPVGTFYAYRLTYSTIHLAGSTIVFEATSYDARNDYSNTTGVFKAPLSGTYSFFVNIYQGTNEHVEIQLMVGSTIAMTTYGHYGESGSPILHLNMDDEVYVRTSPDYPSRTIHGTGWSHFSGTLLHADPVL